MLHDQSADILAQREKKRWPMPTFSMGETFIISGLCERVVCHRWTDLDPCPEMDRLQADLVDLDAVLGLYGMAP
jgi:hypothetical protein